MPRKDLTLAKRALRSSIQAVAEKTQPLVPVKTGRLRGSFIPVIGPFQAKYGTNVEYATDVHDLYPAGQRYRNPSLNKSAVAGFLTVGIDRSRARVDRAFLNAIRQIGDELVK